MEAAIFNPVQQHLLKMFAFDACLEGLWDSGKLNQAKLDELRHQDLHAMLKK